MPNPANSEEREWDEDDPKYEDCENCGELLEKGEDHDCKDEENNDELV